MSFESQSNTSFEKISEKDEALKSLIEQCDKHNLRFDPEQLAKLTTLPTESLQSILLELSALNSNIEEISMWKKTLYTRIFKGSTLII
jgi:hypothetical protein